MTKYDFISDVTENKRTFLVYDGKPYRKAEMTKTPVFVKVNGRDTDAIPQTELINGCETTLKIYAYPFEIHVRVSGYTVEMRQSGRYVYFVRGRETLRRAMPLRMPEPSQELIDILAATA